ncbi:MAG: hypothetical protein DHS20C18_18530 [Saprospiraceae bacterium]|nr:MAG: hypothetical protein DHS20C18_18530 [Saprospiraceae bacterium]
MDLEKLVNQSFEAERDLPFEEDHWDELNRQLDKQKNKSQWPIWWLWLSLVLLLLLLVNWYMQSQTIDRLEHQISELSVASAAVIPQVDTIWRVDTVIRTVRVPVTISSVNEKPIVAEAIAHNSKNKINKYKTQPTDNQNSIASNEQSLFSQISKIQKLVSSLPRLETSRLSLVPFTIETPHIDHLPLNRIGLTYRFGQLKAPANSVESDIGQQQFQQVGLQWGRTIWKGLGFHIEMGQEWQDYQASGSLPASLPAYYGREAPEEYFPITFSIHQQSIYYRLGLDWQLLKSKRISPILGVGFLGQSNLLAEVKTSFATDNPYIDPVLNNKDSYRQDAPSLNYWYAKMGLRWQLFPRWSLQVMGTSFQPNKTLMENQKQYSFETQINYHF